MISAAILNHEDQSNLLMLDANVLRLSRREFNKLAAIEIPHRTLQDQSLSLRIHDSTVIRAFRFDAHFLRHMLDTGFVSASIAEGEPRKCDGLHVESPAKERVLQLVLLIELSQQRDVEIVSPRTELRVLDVPVWSVLLHPRRELRPHNVEIPFVVYHCV